jgi:hypothetical protein
MYRLHHNGRRWFRDLGPVGGWWLSACKGLAAFRALDLVWLGHACPVVVVWWPSNNAPAQEVQGWRGGPAQATPAKEVDLPAGTGHLASDASSPPVWWLPPSAVLHSPFSARFASRDQHRKKGPPFVVSGRTAAFFVLLAPFQLLLPQRLRARGGREECQFDCFTARGPIPTRCGTYGER